jgi:hypothetical protein
LISQLLYAAAALTIYHNHHQKEHRKMNKEVILGLARHILTTLGGVLAGKGVIGASDVEVAVGAVVALAGIVWSVVDKKKPA